MKGLNYAYILNENTYLSGSKLKETTVKEFARAVVDATFDDIKTCEQARISREQGQIVDSKINQNQEARFHVAVADLLSNERCKGIYFGKDGDKNCLVKDASTLENIILNFAKNNPSSKLGQLQARSALIRKESGLKSPGLFEAAVHFMCMDYFENYKSDENMKWYRMNNQHRFT